MSQTKSGLPTDICLQPNREPLYRRAPSRDENGKPLSDFIMLIPGLRDWSSSIRESRFSSLQGILKCSRDVVFADLNVPLNLLWVSVRRRDRVTTDLAAEIQRRFPEARLIGHPGFGVSCATKPSAVLFARAIAYFRIGRVRTRKLR